MPLFTSLQDNFDDNSTDPSKWVSFEDTGTSINETGGRVAVSLPASGGGLYAGYYTENLYDFTNSTVALEITEPSSTSNGLVYMLLSSVDYPFLISLTQRGSTLEHYYVYGFSSSTTTTTFSAVDDRWIRFRSSGSTIYWETSADGFTWSTKRSIVNPAPSLNNMYVEFGGGTHASLGSPMTVSVDNFNTVVTTMSLVSTASGGGAISSSSESATESVTTLGGPGGSATYLTEYQPLPQKDYEYRVFDSDWNYLATWTNEVKSDFSYTQNINQTPSELKISLARSPENRSVGFSALRDQLGAAVLDQNNDTILVQTETANAVGEGTDIDMNYNVKVVAFYGGYEALLDQNGNEVLDENNQSILVQFGHPNGKVVYQGYIADYGLKFGEQSGVDVVVVPHAAEMNQYIFYDGLGNTRVEYNSQDPVLMARDAMDDYISQGGIITYDNESMPLSGQVSSYDFNLQRTKQVVDQTIELLPDNYYHYVDPGENKQYLLQQGSEADHIFWYGYHIKELDLRRSMTQMVNKFVVVGGEVSPGVNLYKYYEDTTSQANWRAGLEIHSDSRIEVSSSAQSIAQRRINAYKDPRWRTSVEIVDATYDIESIKLGDMVGFRNFGNLVDDLILPVVGIKREPHTVTLDLDMTVPNDAKRLEEVKRNVLSEVVRDIPAAPA